MIFFESDKKFMRLAIKLAQKGIGSVEPNPAVGAVIVRQGRIIGQGYHKRFGGPHAEIEAIKDCIKKGRTSAGSTVYVTLEPCCHFGKTGPCTQALIDAKVSRVIAATGDPSAHAAGKGFTQLKKAGIEVASGLCGEEARQINLPFFKYAATGRPWIILKWAQTIDAKLAYAKVDSTHRWITGEKSRTDVHALRRRVQAILVGIGTVLADDPLLTPRPDKARRPLRIILDPQLRLPLNSKLALSAKDFPVLVYTSSDALSKNKAKKLQGMGLTCRGLRCRNGRIDLAALIKDLSTLGNIGQVLVEGGPTVLASFIKAGMADEFRVYIAPKILGSSGTADLGRSLDAISARIALSSVKLLPMDSDICISALAQATY